MKRILHLSDLHFGRSDPRALECIQRFVQEQGSTLDLIIVTGDWTQRARDEQFRRAREFIEAISVPILSLPGNHDVPLYNILARFFWPLRSYNAWIKPITRQTFSADRLAVVGISSVNPYSVADGKISGAEISEAETFFGDAADGAIRILCTHHPVNETPRGEWMISPEAMSRMLVDIALSGHAHRPKVELVAAGDRKLLSIISGTSGSDRLRGESNGFHLLEIEGRKVEVKTYVLEKDGFICAKGNPNVFHL